MTVGGGPFHRRLLERQKGASPWGGAGVGARTGGAGRPAREPAGPRGGAPPRAAGGRPNRRRGQRPAGPVERADGQAGARVSPRFALVSGAGANDGHPRSGFPGRPRHWARGSVPRRKRIKPKGGKKA